MRSYAAHPPAHPHRLRQVPPWPEEAKEDEVYGLLEEAWELAAEVVYTDDMMPVGQPPPMVLVIAVGFVLVVLAIGGLLQLSGQVVAEQIPGTAVPGGGLPRHLKVDDPTAVAAPYAEYTLTQGLHGQSYGHLAIDLAAGRGEPVQSPIHGYVSNLYIDEYGNTTLVLENEVYTVTMLHGDFAVAIGDEVTLGQVVGKESNNGYTMDFFGNLCYGRVYCGNHTHLNIYDKRIQANVNPLDLMP